MSESLRHLVRNHNAKTKMLCDEYEVSDSDIQQKIQELFLLEASNFKGELKKMFNDATEDSLHG